MPRWLPTGEEVLKATPPPDGTGRSNAWRWQTGWTYRWGLGKQSDRLVVKFAEYKGKLNGLPSLTSLTSAPLAAKHAAQPGDLKFAKLTTFSDDIAKALANHKGKLDLSGLHSLSPDAAKALAGHEGELKLGGVKEISDEAAKALALAVGAVSLGSLEKASPAAAAVLKTNTKILLPAKLK